MSSAPAMTLSSLAAQAYADGYGSHGDLDLNPQTFANELSVVIEKHLGSDAPAAVVLAFFRTLHTSDLYLTKACSQPSDRAWTRFATAYQTYINGVARFVSPNRSAARELASDVMADLFIHDRSGSSRIASFDGRQPLAIWLRTLISNRATNLRMLKCNGFECLDGISDIPDVEAYARIEAAIRASKYEAILEDCFKLACQSLTIRERFIILMRYEEGLRVFEIASHLGKVHPTTITRQLQKALLKLQKKIISTLTLKYQLGPAANKECLDDILENPAHSLLFFLKASTRDYKRNQASKVG